MSTNESITNLRFGEESNNQSTDESNIGLVLDDAQFQAINSNAAEQNLVDCVATDETNTLARYIRYQEEFREYCVLVFHDNYECPQMNVERVYNFLYYHAYRPITPKMKKGQKRDKRKRFPKWFNHVNYTTLFSQYKDQRAVVTDLTEEVTFIGYTHLNNIKSALIHMAPEELKKEIRVDSRIKNLVKSVKACNGIQARLQKQEKATTQNIPQWDLLPAVFQLEEQFWHNHSESKNPMLVAAALCDHWCFNDSMQCIVRAESLWKEELSDMLHYTHQVHGEPSKYEALLRVLWDGKTNQKSTGKALLAQCFCHLDPKRCAIGAKAFYLFARFRATQEMFDFTNNDWFQVKTAVALADRGNNKVNDHNKSMGPGTYKTRLDKFQKVLGIRTGKAVHIGRSFGCLQPQLDGVPDWELCILASWSIATGKVFDNHYSGKVPFAAMRSCSGAGKDVGRYWIPRSEISPEDHSNYTYFADEYADASDDGLPITNGEIQQLITSVFFNIEESKANLLSTPDNKCFITAHRFLKVMDYLRIVVLEDAAYFITQCPDRANHVLFSDPIFHSRAFMRYKACFARKYRQMTLPHNDPTLKDVQLVAPKIGNAMETIARTAQENTTFLQKVCMAMVNKADQKYQSKVDLYQQTAHSFSRMENQYLAPMA